MIDFLNRIHSIDRITVDEEIALSHAIQESLRIAQLSLKLETRLNRSPTFTEVAAYADLRGEEHVKDILRSGLEARSTLVNANLRLVQQSLSAVTKRGNLHLNPADLMQEGIIGLIRAAEKYDATKGFRFSTYATIWIRSAISRVAKQDSGSVRLPQKLVALRSRIDKFRREYKIETGYAKDPSPEEIAYALNLTVPRVKACLESAYMQEMTECDDKVQFHAMVNEQGVETNDSEMEILQSDLRNELKRLLRPAEYDSLTLRYGLTDDHMPHTVPEVAELTKQTTAGTHRVLKSAVHKLQSSSVKKLLAAYREDFL